MAKKSKKAKKADKAESMRAEGSNPHVLRAADIAAKQQPFSHPWNPKSELIGVLLGKALGLKRTGVAIARIPAGKESFVPHAHHREEEWLYILMGEGAALIGEDEVRVGAGDFIAFPAPQVTHHLKNVGGDDLVYLMGGEHAKMDVVDFPTLGRRTVRLGDETTVYEVDAAAAFPMSQGGPKQSKKDKKR